MLQQFNEKNRDLIVNINGRLVHRDEAGISPFDPLSFIAATLSVLTALICACWLPARRAAQVDPMEALRYE